MTVGCVPQVVDEIIEVVRLIPQERVQQRCPRPVPQVVGEIVEVVQIMPQERISKRIDDRIVDAPVLMQRQVPIIQTVQKTVEVPQVQFFD